MYGTQNARNALIKKLNIPAFQSRKIYWIQCQVAGDMTKSNVATMTSLSSYLPPAFSNEVDRKLQASNQLGGRRDNL